MMSRKDYKVIAEIVNNTNKEYSLIDRCELAERLAGYFASNNPLFDADKFIKACDIENPVE